MYIAVAVSADARHGAVNRNTVDVLHGAVIGVLAVGGVFYIDRAGGNIAEKFAEIVFVSDPVFSDFLN